MKTFFLLIGLTTGFLSVAQPVETRIEAAFRTLQAEARFKHALIGLYIIDSKTGKVVFDNNAQVGMAPASTLKIITGAAALDLLGKDYRYKTTFSYDGNLHIHASGDPTLGSWRWQSTSEAAIQQRMTGSLAENKISSFTNVFIEDSLWETQATPKGWTWEDIGNYYGAGARGFNWHENQYDLILKPGKAVGDSATIIKTEPDISPAVLINELTTASSGTGDNTIIYLPENGTVGYVRGTIPAGVKTFKVSGALPDPKQTVMQIFSSLCKPGVGNGNKTKQLLFTHSSPPLDSINYWFLQKSINLYGEALVKTIAFEKTGYGATEAGLEVIKDYWTKIGIEKSALNIKDGSGLSPANRVTPHALVSILQYAKEQNWYPAFYNALPAQNGIKMKSGYISGVRSYTGYIKSAAGKEYSFAFIINNYDGSPGVVREKMWKLLDILK